MLYLCVTGQLLTPACPRKDGKSHKSRHREGLWLSAALPVDAAGGYPHRSESAGLAPGIEVLSLKPPDLIL